MENIDMSMNYNEEIEHIEIELLLSAIYQYYGFDFRDYAYSSIRRRLWHRAKIEGVNTISELQGKILHDPKILNSILNDFSINVTEMFRDPSFFRAFRTEIIPLLREQPSIRIWHAGCSSGEEAYSMAILLYEEGLYDKSRIYATDMNENILAKAKKGHLPIDQMQHYTRNYLQSGGKKEFSEYYSVQDNYVTIQPFLQKNIIFAHHNLVTDHSFNEFHVIVCRNVLIYFNSQLKNRVYNLFNESLSQGGFVCFGSKETITDRQALTLFQEVNVTEKIYSKNIEQNK